MKLSEVLQNVTVLNDYTEKDIEINSLSFDTRNLQNGALFVAISGYRWDGNAFIEKAINAGAAAVICEKKPNKEGPWIVVEDTRRALAQISANWFGNPAKEMTILGVTGTNGKTTTTYLLKQMLENLGEAKVGLIGTNQNMIGDDVIASKRTTPESYDLHELFRSMADAGCKYVVMEVSSHALMLERVYGIEFKVGIFTNLSQDHLDFHGDMNRYREAKGKLFEQCETGVFNIDDEAGMHFAQHATCQKFTYSENKVEADLLAQNIRIMPEYIEFEALILGGINRVRLPIPGGFNIYNALGVIACGLVLGFSLLDTTVSLRDVAGVRGRVEIVKTPMSYTVVIDYAHTPNALENILMTAREFAENRVICVFGCGGDRDREKRPIMGSIASNLADLVIVTSDNPRTESPEEIIEEIELGMTEQNKKKIIEIDREKAIRYALKEGKVGDVIVLAGKGHETYQEIGLDRFHFDEREVIDNYFKERM